MNENVQELERKVMTLHCMVQTAKLFIICNVEEVKNDGGGVIGYKLDLDPFKTKYLMEILNEKHA